MFKYMHIYYFILWQCRLYIIILYMREKESHSYHEKYSWKILYICDKVMHSNILEKIYYNG